MSDVMFYRMTIAAMFLTTSHLRLHRPPKKKYSFLIYIYSKFAVFLLPFCASFSGSTCNAEHSFKLSFFVQYEKRIKKVPRETKLEFENRINIDFKLELTQLNSNLDWNLFTPKYKKKKNKYCSKLMMNSCSFAF